MYKEIKDTLRRHHITHLISYLITISFNLLPPEVPQEGFNIYIRSTRNHGFLDDHSPEVVNNMMP